MITGSTRPDPDALLRQIEADESDVRFGRLKIFLGYASGVGKSLRMLDEGRRRRERGQDVVVGAIQPDVDEAQARLLHKLELIPLKQVDHVPVLDLDTILKRNPAVCLVDGLAYRNPPGTRNAKRWQDVQELLDAKISVITSINIQFIEELQPKIEAITKKRAAESVPQSFISSADEIVVVDAPPETCFVRSTELGIDPRILEQRLSELREIALLLAADVVDRQLERYLQQNGLTSSMGAQERILVCISPQFDASAIVASGRRNADRFHGDLYAVFVRNQNLTPEEEAQVERNLQIAREAGAQVEVLNEEDPVEAILDFARAKRVTQIFLGHSAKTNWWQKLTGASLDKLIRQAEGFDVRLFPN
jgi:two-component system, OmpR family, sensor histidine kinase KdpD